MWTERKQLAVIGKFNCIVEVLITDTGWKLDFSTEMQLFWNKKNLNWGCKTKERRTLLSPLFFGKLLLLFCVKVICWVIRRFKLIFFMLHSVSLRFGVQTLSLMQNPITKAREAKAKTLEMYESWIQPLKLSFIRNYMQQFPEHCDGCLQSRNIFKLLIPSETKGSVSVCFYSTVQGKRKLWWKRWEAGDSTASTVWTFFSTTWLVPGKPLWLHQWKVYYKHLSKACPLNTALLPLY